MQMTKTRLLFCLNALVLLASDSAFAQRPVRSDAMEIRQQCIVQAQSRFPSSGTNNSNRQREMAYAACVNKQGVRP
jgi:hypothetical protein